jgi:glutaredoxin-like protein NrdH
MSAITVYTKPGCPQCIATLRALDRVGLACDTVDLTDDTEARDYTLSLGYLQAPVVIAGGHHWSGYRPDRIANLAQHVA